MPNKQEPILVHVSTFFRLPKIDVKVPSTGLESRLQLLFWNFTIFFIIILLSTLLTLLLLLWKVWTQESFQKVEFDRQGERTIIIIIIIIIITSDTGKSKL